MKKASQAVGLLICVVGAVSLLSLSGPNEPDWLPALAMGLLVAASATTASAFADTVADAGNLEGEIHRGRMRIVRRSTRVDAAKDEHRHHSI